MESGLWKFCAGAQRRGFTKLACELGRNLKFVCPKYARLSSSSSSSSTSPSPSNSPRQTGFIMWYSRKLATHPIITKCVSSSLIYTSADITSQMITMPEDGSFDLFRMLRMSTFGLLIMGPSQHYWFTCLSKIVIMPQPHMNVATTLSKILMDQIIYGPCTTTIFFSYNAALQGESGDEIVARLKRDLIPTLKNRLMYWSFYDFMTLMCVPVHLQPLVNSSFAYLWTVYLTNMVSLKKVGTNKRSASAENKLVQTGATI